MNQNEIEILSVQELAAECGLTEGRIRQLIGSGRIQTIRVGKWVHAIARQEAERFKSERQRESGRSERRQSSESGRAGSSFGESLKPSGRSLSMVYAFQGAGSHWSWRDPLRPI